MFKEIKNSIMLLSLLVSVGCASSGQVISQYQSLIKDKKYSEAQNLLKTKKLYSDKESELLFFLENASTNLYLGNNYLALQFFDQARDLSDKLFTISISKKLSSTVTGESNDVYYGDNFERSLIRYYSILTHLKIYEIGEYEEHEIRLVSKDENGKEVESVKKIERQILTNEQRQNHLSAARAIVLEWNSILENYKNTYAGELVYKDELLAKFLGAIVHQKINTNTDKQIALNLYKESEKVKFRFFNSYESFNQKYKLFNDNFKKFPTLKEEKIKSDYVLDTKYSSDLKEYTDRVIKDWNKTRDNTYLIVHLGNIVNKTAEKYKFPIDLGVGYNLAPNEISGFTAFSRSLLFISSASVPLIEFEITKVPYRKFEQDYDLIVKNSEGHVISKKALLVNPSSEIAYLNFENNKSSMIATKSARLVTKHISALVASYTTYKNLTKSLGPDGAHISGMLTYVGLNRAIAQSEKADTRSWHTLPDSIVMNSFTLNSGEYQVYLKDNSNQTEKTIGIIKIDEKQTNISTFFE